VLVESEAGVAGRPGVSGWMG